MITSPRSTQAGMSMIELMAIVLTLTAGLSIGFIGLSKSHPALRRSQVREQFRGDLLIAKSKAVAERTRVILKVTSTGYQIGYDYPPYSTTGTFDTASSMKLTRKFPSRFAMEIKPVNYLTFDSRGNLVDDITGQITQGTVTLKYDGAQFLAGTVYPTGLLQ